MTTNKKAVISEILESSGWFTEDGEIYMVEHMEVDYRVKLKKRTLLLEKREDSKWTKIISAYYKDISLENGYIDIEGLDGIQSV